MVTEVSLEAGLIALDAGDWRGAKDAFEAVLAEGDLPEAHEGLSRSLWWLQDVDGAIVQAERAYAGLRARGEKEAAARLAMWLAHEYAAVHGNDGAASGWFARAEGLLRESGDVPELGWLALTKAERAGRPAEARRLAGKALELARRLQDPDLEAAALARIGYAEIAAGDVEDGTIKIDEAMATATGGEVRRLETIGDVTCVAIAAFELSADWQRIEQWGQVMDGWIRQHNSVSVLGFCYACCAEMFVASGEWEQAEGLLSEGLGALQAAGQRSRCVHPAAKLAELRLLQGRISEAEQLLSGFEDLPEATHALASLHLARGQPVLAAAVLHRRLNWIGDDNVLAAPFLALLVDVQLAQGDVVEAASTAVRLGAIAERSGIPRIAAHAHLSRGKAEAAAGEATAAASLESSLAAFAELGIALEAARTRLELAKLLEPAKEQVAIEETRTALAEFERLGAPRDADAAARFLRDHGVSGRTGPKGMTLLSRRELEVLHLVGEGLTNAEIGARLFISTKTAGHHVSNILAKLQLRSRTEAATYALRYSGEIPERD